MCSSCFSSSLWLPPPPSFTSPSEIKAPLDDAYESLDDQFLSVAQELPEFAGFYLNEDGDYVVNLASKPGLQTASVTDVEKAIEGVFGTGYLNRDISALSNGTQTPQVQIRAVRYTFEDLAEYHEEALELAEEYGLLFIDIDEVENTVTLGVESETHAEKVRGALSTLGVPIDGITIEITEPARSLRGLSDRVRPVPAGVRASFIKDGRNTYCTKGFNVKRNGVQGFIVNSHCTRSMGFVDGVRFYNNFVGSNNAIGVETVDPPFYRKFPQCPPHYPLSQK